MMFFGSQKNFVRKKLGEFGTTGYSQLETEKNKILPISSLDSLANIEKATAKVFASSDLTSSHYSKSENILHAGKEFNPKKRYWSTSTQGMYRIKMAGRLLIVGDTLRYKRYLEDFDVIPISNLWNEQLSEQNKSYVVQTSSSVIQRCLLMASDPGDLVLDPTCGSGTTAYVAEQWGQALDYH
jgi:adenine-specific DNA-methyltransferase